MAKNIFKETRVHYKIVLLILFSYSVPDAKLQSIMASLATSLEKF